NQGIGVIVAQLPRQTELCRPDSRGQLKPVAANVDLIVIVFAPLPEPHANLIDRYLVAAEHAGITPLLLLNKADLVDEQNEKALNALLGVYRSLGYPLLEVSARDGDGMDSLRARLDGHVSVFVGQSGAGRGNAGGRPIENDRQGLSHHLLRTAFSFPRWRRADRFARHTRIRADACQPRGCGSRFHRVPRCAGPLSLSRLQA